MINKCVTKTAECGTRHKYTITQIHKYTQGLNYKTR